jgi:LuxR family transcriptional regulator, maltose regulon positive regulatory protein
VFNLWPATIRDYNHHVATLLPTKFYLPPAPASFVPRPQLFEKLDEALAHRLTLVSSPAGAGKTALVSTWAHAARKKGVAIGWLSLDASDNNPARFLECIIAGLEEEGTVIDTDPVSPQHKGQVQIKEVLNLFIWGLANLQRELILILDDYHHIQDKEVHAALDYLLKHAPPCLHFILLTRSDPPLELARLRVAGQLIELRMNHLRFSVQEASDFMKKFAGITLTESDAASLTARTEGWIAGLQMAGISLRGQQDVSAFIAAFAGSHRFVFDYLLEQVLNQQDLEIREFLLKTSVLERLSAPLCDAVTGTAGAARRSLDTLERANLFLTPLDDERVWYRYHHLFSDLLKLVLEQAYPGLAVELHSRACRWFEEQGKIPEAFQHALAADDIELAARLVSANVLALVEQAELLPILSRMDSTPRGQREANPWLEVAHAWALAYTGQMERGNVALTLAEKHLKALPAHERSRITGHISAVRAYAAWVNGSQQEAVELAETAARLLPVDEIAIRALNLTTMGNALTQYNASPRAAEVLEQAVMLARQAGQSHVHMLAASSLSYAYIQLGRLYKAHEALQDAIEIAETHQQRTGQPLTAAACVYAELASILGEWGEIGPAIRAARKGLALSELWGQADAIVLCLLNLINALSLAKDKEAGIKAIQRSRRLAQKVSPWFVLNVDHLEARFWLDMNDIPQADRTIREAVGPLPATLEARLLVKQNRPDKALTLLDQASPEFQHVHSFEIVRLGAVQSLALFQKRGETGALAALEPALELAQVENQVMTFVREGEAMERLLHLARRKSICPDFTQKLLSVFEAQRKPRPTPAAEPLIEALSERELEVLGLLNGPLSTPEIARQLILSTNTVRTHIKNIYGKLGVHGRSGAVRRARELGLLE